MKMTITLTELRALEAANAGTLHRGPIEDDRAVTGSRLGIWRLPDGRAVTMSTLRAIDHGYIAEGEPLDDGRIPAIVTDLGRAVLDELASRQPAPKE